MKQYYIKSLQMIKEFNIKKEKEYRELTRNYLILNLESLKWMAQTRSWRKIIKIANEV